MNDEVLKKSASNDLDIDLKSVEENDAMKRIEKNTNTKNERREKIERRVDDSNSYRGPSRRFTIDRRK